ncbi:TraR/DksA C4-type zinc finger protein [Bacteriovoracaceae bacterium]|nr:TraR/DksA C4-type zinc finger protein [Bacteriovoracaceae bacterium]
MNKKKIDYFKEKLLTAKQEILNGGILANTDDMKIDSEDLSDEADLAANTINQQVSFSIRERELSKLRRIEAALNRIDHGTFGICEESGETIEEKRLENQPWTEFCLEIAEEREREANQRFRKSF